MDGKIITIGSAKRALGVEKWADFARALGLCRQSMTGRRDTDPIPDAWIGRAARRGKNIFGEPQPEPGEPADKKAAA